MTKLIKITTTQNITYNYFCSGTVDLEKYVKLVMKSACCPARSIVTITIEEV